MARSKKWKFLALLGWSLLALHGGAVIGQTPPAGNAIAHSQTADKSPAPAPQRPARVITDFSQFHLDQMPKKSRQPEVGAASRGSVSRLTLCAPSSGVTLSTRPLFEWRAPDGGAAKVTFSLLNENGDVLYENEVSGTSFEYPADAPALQPGQTYSWKVSGGEISRLPEPVAITLQDKAEQAGVRSALASASDPLVYAQVFLRNGLWYDTVAALEGGMQKHPERKDLQEQLSKLYQEIAPACATP
jgi:hypothetical protein